MKTISYKVKEVKPNIFAVIVKDSYDRAMLFCRYQEFYESPNPKFRGKDFSIWDYMKWYSSNRKGFSYADDWSGFNIPYDVLEKCIDEQIQAETPYDDIMYYIYVEITKLKKDGKAYIIGTDDLTSDTFDHELCHGLWYTNKKYKKQAEILVKKLPKAQYKHIKNELLSMGYTDKVINDEIQAYMSTGLCPSFNTPAIAASREPFINNFKAFKNGRR